MKTEEIVQRLRDNARKQCPPKFPVERMVVWIAADALEAQAREIERLRADVSEWKRQAAIAGMEASLATPSTPEETSE